MAAVYFFLVAGLIEDLSLHLFKDDVTYLPVFGLLILALNVLELYAFPKKIKLVGKLLKDKRRKFGTNSIVLWLFHLTISVVAIIVILNSFGYDLGGDQEDISIWIALVIMAVVIKEIYLLMFFINDDKLSEKEYKKLKKKEWIYDIILILYSWFAFTIMWTAVSKVGNTDMNKENILMYVLNLVIVSVLFLIFYLPLRIPYFLEEQALIKTKEDYFKFIFSILIVLVALVLKL